MGETQWCVRRATRASAAASAGSSSGGPVAIEWGSPPPDGRLYRAPSTFDSKDDAVAWLAARRAEIQLNIWAPDMVELSVAKKAVPTFKDYAKRWLSTRKTRGLPLRPTTRDHYEYVLESALYPTFGNMPIDEITVEDVNDWYEKGRLGPGVATGTVGTPRHHEQKTPLGRRPS